MLVREIKEAIQTLPDELEVVADVFEKDGATLSKKFRVRIEDIAIEATSEIEPIINPQFKGKQVLCLKFLKKRNSL